MRKAIAFPLALRLGFFLPCACPAADSPFDRRPSIVGTNGECMKTLAFARPDTERNLERRIDMRPKLKLLISWVLLLVTYALGQTNGKLQLHFMNVGQGEGALLISLKAKRCCSTAVFATIVIGLYLISSSWALQKSITLLSATIMIPYRLRGSPSTGIPLAQTVFDRGGTYRAELSPIIAAFVGSKRKQLWRFDDSIGC